MRKHITIVLCCLILGISCQQPIPIPHGSWDDTVKDMTFSEEIPINKVGKYAGKPYLIYTFTHYDAWGLKLDSLEGGYNSFQLRVWLGDEMAKVKNVVIITCVKQHWHANIISWRNPTGHEPGRVIIGKRDTEPASGWGTFIKKMLELQVLDLQNANDLKDYNGCGADGIDYKFEIATVNKYRYYSYCDPDDNKEKFWQAKNVMEFADLLEKEFNFTYTK